MRKIFLFVLCNCLVFAAVGQMGISIPSLPSVPVPQVPDPRKHPGMQPGPSGFSYEQDRQQQSRNAALIREAETDIRRTMEEQRRRERIEMLIRDGFFSQDDGEGTRHFYSAFDEIKSMLAGETPLSLERAVFLTDNAYYGNALDYEDYQQGIQEAVRFCYRKIEEENLDPANNMVKNMMLFRFIADTLRIENRGNGAPEVHYPIRYDYEDYDSKIHYDSHFVTTLMRTGTGQCYSMPLYYLILAEQLGAEAYWAFAPKHSFIKIKDEKGSWYNLELTCSAILSDTHYLNSGHIKAEALRNRIYMEPMDKSQIVAELLLDLARRYFKKYGLDDFYLSCIDTAEPHLSNNLNSLMLRAFYTQNLVLFLAHVMGTPSVESFREASPEAYRHYETQLALFEQIDNLGYEEFPEDLYAKWLDYVAREKEKVEKGPSVFFKN